MRKEGAPVSERPFFLSFFKQNWKILLGFPKSYCDICPDFGKAMDAEGNRK